MVMWWTPWLWSFRMWTSVSVFDELRLVLASLQRAPRHELHVRLHDQQAAQSRADGVREPRVGLRVAGELHGDREGRVLRHPRAAGAHQDVAADPRRELRDHLADG